MEWARPDVSRTVRPTGWMLLHSGVGGGEGLSLRAGDWLRLGVVFLLMVGVAGLLLSKLLDQDRLRVASLRFFLFGACPLPTSGGGPLRPRGFI